MSFLTHIFSFLILCFNFCLHFSEYSSCFSFLGVYMSTPSFYVCPPVSVKLSFVYFLVHFKGLLSFSVVSPCFRYVFISCFILIVCFHLSCFAPPPVCLSWVTSPVTRSPPVSTQPWVLNGPDHMLFFVLVESAVFIPLVSLSFLSLGPAFFSPSYFLCPRLTFFFNLVCFFHLFGSHSFSFHFWWAPWGNC